jgi:hypothetical protein
MSWVVDADRGDAIPPAAWGFESSLARRRATPCAAKMGIAGTRSLPRLGPVVAKNADREDAIRGPETNGFTLPRSPQKKHAE